MHIATAGSRHTDCKPFQRAPHHYGGVILAYLRDGNQLPQRGSRPIDGGMCLIALAFSTLLSSQGADAHLQRTPVRLQGNYSNLPDQPPPVNPKPLEDFEDLG